MTPHLDPAPYPQSLTLDGQKWTVGQKVMLDGQPGVIRSLWPGSLASEHRATVMVDRDHYPRIVSLNKLEPHP